MAQEKKTDVVKLTPGTAVDIMVNLDMINERTDVRRSIVYDMEEGNRIILSQTTPAMARYHIGKDMDLTFLHEGEEGPTRFGLTAKLTDIIKDYKLYSAEAVPALLMLGRPRASLVTYNLRMFHRVKPSSKDRVKFILNKQEFSLVDMSIGGLCFTHGRDGSIEVGKIITAQLEIDETAFTTDIQITRTWSPPKLQRNNLEYASGQFVNTEKRLSFVLSGKVLEIERKQLNRGLE